jgi:predicted Zn-dependent protease
MSDVAVSRWIQLRWWLACTILGFPLLIAAALWCPFDQEPIYGFLLKDEDISRIEGREGAGQRVVVAYVHSRLPTVSTGLAPGDVLMRVNQRDVTDLRAEEIMQLVRRLTVARIQPLQLEIMRAGDRHTLYMWATPACRFSVQLIESQEVNGIADGRRVGVTTGAMRFLHSDSELAWVLAHEIGYNVLNHSQNDRLSAMLNAFLGATVGTSAAVATSVPRRSLEAQADYIGAYIMARAGFDVHAIKQFWRRMDNLRSGEKQPELDVSHPTTAERLAALEVTLTEIQEKRNRGDSPQPVLEKTH